MDINKVEEVGTHLVNLKWEKENLYTDWLAQTYYFVRHSTRLLALASSRFELTEQILHNRFNKHIAEEQAHELLLVKDLKYFNYCPQNFKENSFTASFYQIQYYMIEHKGPESLFGYILCLEYLAAKYGDFMYKKVKEVYGDKAANFLRVHSQEDIEHVEEALQNIDCLSSEKKNLVQYNLNISVDLYLSLINNLEFNEKSLKEAS